MWSRLYLPARPFSVPRLSLVPYVSKRQFTSIPQPKNIPGARVHEVINTQKILHPVTKWTTEDVARWARDTVGLKELHLQKLVESEISGKSLFDLTEERIRSYGIPGGPAIELIKAIEALKTPADRLSILTQASALEILSADHNHVKLWHAILDNKVQFMVTPNTSATHEEDSAALTLLNGITWLHDNSVLFMRHDVFCICDIIQQEFIQGTKGIVVIGTPGIGKSVQVGNLLFYRAAKAKRNVIFESVVNDTAYFFDVDYRTVHKLKNSRRISWPEKFTEDRNTLYLMDAGAKGNRREPDLLKAFTVVTASPNELHYGNWLKTIGYGNRLFLPPWTWDEIMRVFPFVTLSGIPEEVKSSEVRIRFNIFGGITRYLFGTKQDFIDAKKQLDAALVDMNSFDVNRLRHYETAWEKIPNFVFVILSTTPYRSNNSRIEVSSPYVLEQLEQAVSQNKYKALGQFVHLVASEVNFGSPRGQAMELYTIEKVRSGGLFTVRNLSDGKQSTMSLPCSTRVGFIYHEKVFSELEIVSMNTMLVPVSKRFQGFDFFLFIDNVVVACQTTVKTERYLPLDELKKDLVQLFPKLKGSPSEVILVFAVDSVAYEKFHLVTKKGKTRQLPKTIMLSEKLCLPLTVLAMCIEVVV